MLKTIILNATQYELLKTCLDLCIADNASDRAKAAFCGMDTTYYTSIAVQLQELQDKVKNATTTHDSK